ncbi:hypothetical protein [Myroides sp. N17-2]|uniref:hypothetical protein n=1 Tax=Myroides sp. N17-2 TaxID=2030799 RepID=UPI000EFB09A5|nr:hypothetical protein [Myroides sp. N17-2]
MIGKQTVLNLVNDIGQTYVQRGFISTQKGLVLKHTIASNGFELVLKFHIINSEVKESMAISCVIMVLSEQLKEWRLNKYRSRDLAVDTVFIAQLQEIIPEMPKKFSWDITQKNVSEFRDTMASLFANYVETIFDLFINEKELINHIIEYGWRLNEFMSSEHFVYPIDFMCCFASHEQNVTGFNNYLKREGLSSQAKRVYKEMSSPKYKGFLVSDAVTDKVFQIAYIHKIPILI